MVIIQSKEDLLDLLCGDLVQKKNTVMSECQSECPKECDSITYQIVQSTVPLSNPDSCQLKFYFYEPTYTKMTQSPKISLSSLISDIGGTLSLFIGFKFLSLIEFAEFLIESLNSIFSKKKLIL